jgi:hypothetical protein
MNTVCVGVCVCVCVCVCMRMCACMHTFFMNDVTVTVSYKHTVS